MKNERIEEIINRHAVLKEKVEEEKRKGKRVRIKMQVQN